MKQKTTQCLPFKYLQFFVVFLFLSCLSLKASAQTTEAFEDESVNATTFSDNGQSFTIENGSGEISYDIETYAGGGWNGTFADNIFIDNSAGSPALGDGSSFTIKTTDGTDITLKSFYLFVSRRNLSDPNPPTTTLTFTGKKDGITVFSIIKSSGIVNAPSLTPNNGFTFINFSTEGGSDNSNTNVDEILISATNDADYLALDAFTWGVAPTCTAPDIPTAGFGPPVICDGNSALISISGNKNDATQWSVYTGSCGGTLVTTTTGSSVIVTPTPPSTTYYIRGEGGCVTPGACGTITINTTAKEDASFNYDASAYCIDGADPTPTITGVSGGYFSASGGLSINSNTGTIDVSASTPNTYTVEYNSPGLCDGTEAVSVTINGLDDASFSYSAASYCADASDPTPTITGVTGGTFSSTVGISINASTGEIDVSATVPNTYTIMYTTAGSCPNSSSVSVTINALPTVTFTAPADLCIDAGVQASLGGGIATGGVYSGTGVTDDGNGTSYSFDPAGAGVGTHTITYTFTNANGCTNAASDAIEVFALPTVAFTAPADLCIDAGVQASLGGGTATGGVYSGTGVTDDGNGTSYSFDPAVAGIGTHTITYTYTNANGCTNAASDTIEVFALPTVAFTAPADLCIDAGEQTGLGGGTATGGVYSGTGVADDGNGTSYSFDPAVAGIGTHTITYTYTNANGCTNAASDAIEVFALPTVTFTAPADLCIDAGVQASLGGGTATGGVYSGTGVTDDGNGMTYSFDPAGAGVGTHTITYTYTNANGCTNAASDTIEVFALPTVAFTAPADLCIDAGVQAGLGGGTATGGVYSGAGVTDDGNGMTYSFDPSAAGVGTHTISYAFTNANGCTNAASDAIEVFALPTVAFTAPADLCIDAGEQTGLGGGTATGGVYSGAGVTDDGDGMTYSFDPAAAGVGTHTITYAFTNANGCTNSASDTMEVFAIPTVAFTAPADLCIDAGEQTGLGGGIATGGVYSGAGVTDDGDGMTYSFDPAGAGIGIHTITYTYTNANGCTNAASDTIEVFALPTVAFTAPADLCIDAGVQTGLGGGTATGGVYSGAGVTDDGDGMTYSFDPAGAGIGIHTITYTYTNANGCTNAASDTIEVFALPTVAFTAPADLCIDAGVQTGLGGGTATGGVYSGAGVTDDGDGMTYSFDPAGAGIGIHTITYTYTNANGCTNAASDTIEVFVLPTVTFTAPADLCIDAGVQTGLGGGTATGGVYSGAGVTDDGNGMTYSFDPAAAGVGTHTISYAFTNANGCTNAASDAIEVFALPTVAFTAPADLCIDAGEQTGLGGGIATGGVYSGAGVTDDGNGMTYSFDPAAAGVGTHTITYAFTNANGCTNSASDTVEVLSVDNTITQVGVVLTANEAGATYQWYQCPSTLLTGETAQDFTPLTNGDYKVVVTSGGCVVESLCVTISTLGIDTFENEVKFSMYPNPSSNNVSFKSAISGDFEIVNLLGQTVKAFKIKANIVTDLYIGDLSEGMYLVKARDRSNIISKKLIIKK
ncbi:T9SS type A sorting domain-containing protein [Olleya sp. Bg11-27]|uniref:T9SS type A sorting domain-containing protein n=1 Tax=Olleya sp. Bg11-27 TaxID=2058135 RepID=UPI0012FE4224|nr:T9SS type A sorting domain-containing protein [Olleya sp. Bg11-27]